MPGSPPSSRRLATAHRPAPVYTCEKTRTLFADPAAAPFGGGTGLEIPASPGPRSLLSPKEHISSITLSNKTLACGARLRHHLSDGCLFAQTLVVPPALPVTAGF